jgi:hypothetical protein
MVTLHFLFYLYFIFLQFFVQNTLIKNFFSEQMYVAATKQYQQQQPPQQHINGERKRSKRERPKPSGSALVSDTENQQLFEVLGPDRISTCAGVAQLFDVDANNSSNWRKVEVGLAVLIKDYAKKRYALCLYNIYNKKIVWEQVL